MRYTLALMAAAVAVQASPFPQAVTSAISPSAPAPSGCTPSYAGTFGIAVMNLTAAASSGAAGVTTKSDGQPGASTSGSVRPVTTISDGQPQATTKASVAPVTTISDGQPQATTKASVAPVSTISDGQPQAPTKTSVAAVSQISDGQIQATTMMTMSPINQISDGQIQNQKSTVVPVSTISDGQPQATKSTASAVKTISDGQPQASKTSAVNTLSDGQPQASKTSAVGTKSDGQPTASASSSSSSGGTSYVACKGSDTLQITLANGILKDNVGRTGYIASNYQFQFDGPPQAGAIYTAGFSACGNGSLALGGSAVFYQCLSGNFYNLYDRNWAPQCSPITIQTVQLVNC